MQHEHTPHERKEGKGPYFLLLLMAVFSFVAMYVLMYAMVDRFSNVLPNWNQAYMAALMTAPMVLIELLLMRSMYRRPRLNVLVAAVAIVVGVGAFVAIRKQSAIGDRQFLRSMIPHHAAAILMCEESAIEDPEVRALCERIRASQQAEIDQMKRILERMGK